MTQGPKCSEIETLKIVISGAGPAGLLTALHLLRHNEDPGSSLVRYNVTLIDNNVDYGSLSNEDLKLFHRSWMIALTDNGIKALKEIPDLFEKYVQPMAVLMEWFSVRVGRRILSRSSTELYPGDTYVVDRNFVVAALARYIKDHFGTCACFNFMTETKAMFVDVDCQRILTRSTKCERDPSGDRYVPYDFIVGCDGVRSIVRDGVANNHRDFAFDISDTFAIFKSVHIERPSSMKNAEATIFVNSMPHMVFGVALPEMGNKLNIGLGYYKNDECDAEMKSNDPKVVAKYVKEKFLPFTLDDYDDFAEQWVAQPWSTTGQVHCNFYHSCKCKILLLGDAAHATSPTLGMGMNTALEDSSVFMRLLDEFNHNWMIMMPEFSKERVKIGHALTDISFYSHSFCPRQSARMQITGFIRSKLSRWTGGLVMGDPLDKIGLQGYSLADAYEDLLKLKRIQPIKEKNDRIIRAHFEKSTGMIKQAPTTPTWLKALQITSIGTFVLIAVTNMKIKK